MGPVYGSKDSWNGLMVALDTYDKRDDVSWRQPADSGRRTGDGFMRATLIAGRSQRSNTFVLGLMNHGNLEYSTAKHPMSHILSGCFREYRNLKAPVKVRVMYANQTVFVSATDQPERSLAG